MILRGTIYVVAAMTAASGCGASPPTPRAEPPRAEPPRAEPPRAEPSSDKPESAPDSSDEERLGRVFDDAVAWSAVPTAGLPEMKYPMNLRPFGRWPDAAFILANHEDEHGVAVPGLYRFDPDAKRWTSLGFSGHFRAGIEVLRLSPQRWLLIRSGSGVGGNIPVRVAVAGIDLPQLLRAELPCRSETSSALKPFAGDGSWSFRCGSMDGGRDTQLHFAPGSVEPTVVTP